jgi:nitrogen regulatory protein PII
MSLVTPVKRVEIVVDSVELPRVLAAVKACGINGYTVLPGVEGDGDRGPRSGDQPANVMRNVMLLIACSPDQGIKLADKVRPMLKRFGGMCLITDATWVDH